MVTIDGEAAGRAPLVASGSAAAADLLERYDAAIPGSRLVAWALAIGALALLLIGAIALWDRRRLARSPAGPG